MGKLGDALRALMDNSNISDPGQMNTIQAAIDEDDEKNPSSTPDSGGEEEEKTGDNESGRSATQAKVQSGIQQKKDGK